MPAARGALTRRRFHLKVKNGVEITLRTIHLGSARRVVTLEIDGNAAADEFLMEISKSNFVGFQNLRGRIEFIAEHDRYERKETFRSLGDGLYEFKTRDGLRLYAFYDELPGLEPQLIIATSGGGKGKQNRDIRQARALRESYLLAKTRPDTRIRLIP
jgi:putative component of toxin-antitoxin plasmid stabilization module